MNRQLLFLAGALCIIATISLVHLHLIDTQYAAVALSTSQRDDGGISATNTTLATTTPLFPIAKTFVSTTPARSMATSTKPVVHAIVPAITAHASVAAPVATAADFDAINPIIRDAVVNIICVAPNSDTPISGSGVIIDPRGVILTNAHVAQYVLLQDSNQVTLACTVRTGSPARNAWHVEVLYISSRWIAAHAKDIRQEHQLGTGENDYALLRITDSATATPLPATFPSIGINTNFQSVTPEQSVEIASYPAGFLGGIEAFGDMSLISTVTTIKQIFTFSEAHTADLISLGGVIVAQSGSSGGAVVDQWKNLVAIIATSSTGDATADRDLRAVTLFHINQSMMEETKLDLASYLKGNLDDRLASFQKDTEPSLIKQVIDALMAK